MCHTVEEGNKNMKWCKLLVQWMFTGREQNNFNCVQNKSELTLTFIKNNYLFKDCDDGFSVK